MARLDAFSCQGFCCCCELLGLCLDLLQCGSVHGWMEGGKGACSSLCSI